MNIYEQIYKKATSRGNGSTASWLDSAIAPLAVDIEAYTGEETHVGGPCGLRAEVIIETKTKIIVITPAFEGGNLELYYDTGEKRGRYSPNTLGGMNGFDNAQARLPENIDEIVRVMTTKKNGGADDE